MEKYNTIFVQQAFLIMLWSQYIMSKIKNIQFIMKLYNAIFGSRPFYHDCLIIIIINYKILNILIHHFLRT